MNKLDSQTRAQVLGCLLEGCSIRATATRLSNGFSRKFENHAAAVALNHFAYNFVRIHRKVTHYPVLGVFAFGADTRYPEPEP